MADNTTFDHEFGLRLGTTLFAGWETISVARSMERMSGEFDLEFTAKDDDPYLAGGMVPGQKCAVEIDGKTVLQGFTDTINYDYNKTGAKLRVSGRDQIGDLIDCAANAHGPFEFTNQTLEAIISNVIQPFGLKLTVETATGAPFARLAINPGESWYTAND